MNGNEGVDLVVSEHEQGFRLSYEGKGKYGGKGEVIITALDAEKMADYILQVKEINLRKRLKGEATT